MKKFPRPEAQEISNNTNKKDSKPIKGTLESRPNPKIKTPITKSKQQSAPSLAKRVKQLKEQQDPANIKDQWNSKDGGQATFAPQTKESAIETRIEPPDFGI